MTHPLKTEKLRGKKSLEMLKKASMALARHRRASGSIPVSFQDGEKMEIPAQVADVLFMALSAMGDGREVEIVPSRDELTTQQAAELLNVSRPHVVSLLEKGSIPFRKVGTHRRVLASDVMEYKKVIDGQREKALDELAAQAQHLDLGY